MLYHAFLFIGAVVIAAGLLGFGANAFATAGLAKALFFIFVILFLISMISHLGTGMRI